MIIKGKFYRAKITNKERVIEFFAVNRNTIRVNGQNLRIQPTFIPNRYSTWIKEKKQGVTLESQIFFDIEEK